LSIGHHGKILTQYAILTTQYRILFYAEK